MNSHRCPICGYPGISDDTDDLNSLLSSFEICNCCGVEFGLEVYVTVPGGAGKRIERLRKIWVGRGHKWWASKGGVHPPPDWDWQKNLISIDINPDTCESMST